jgi:hypothetical protein
MTINTVPVAISANLVTGGVVPNGTAKFVLTRADVDNTGVVVQAPIIVQLDDASAEVLALVAQRAPASEPGPEVLP